MDSDVTTVNDSDAMSHVSDSTVGSQGRPLDIFSEINRLKIHIEHIEQQDEVCTEDMRLSPIYLEPRQSDIQGTGQQTKLLYESDLSDTESSVSVSFLPTKQAAGGFFDHSIKFADIDNSQQGVGKAPQVKTGKVSQHKSISPNCDFDSEIDPSHIRPSVDQFRNVSASKPTVDHSKNQNKQPIIRGKPQGLEISESVKLISPYYDFDSEIDPSHTRPSVDRIRNAYASIPTVDQSDKQIKHPHSRSSSQVLEISKPVELISSHCDFDSEIDPSHIRPSVDRIRNASIPTVDHSDNQNKQNIRGTSQVLEMSESVESIDRKEIGEPSNIPHVVEVSPDVGNMIVNAEGDSLNRLTVVKSHIEEIDIDNTGDKISEEKMDAGTNNGKRLTVVTSHIEEIGEPSDMPHFVDVSLDGNMIVNVEGDSLNNLTLVKSHIEEIDNTGDKTAEERMVSGDRLTVVKSHIEIGEPLDMPHGDKTSEERMVAGDSLHRLTVVKSHIEEIDNIGDKTAEERMGAGTNNNDIESSINAVRTSSHSPNFINKPRQAYNITNDKHSDVIDQMTLRKMTKSQDSCGSDLHNLSLPEGNTTEVKCSLNDSLVNTNYASIPKHIADFESPSIGALLDSDCCELKDISSSFKDFDFKGNVTIETDTDVKAFCQVEPNLNDVMNDLFVNYPIPKEDDCLKGNSSYSETEKEDTGVMTCSTAKVETKGMSQASVSTVNPDDMCNDGATASNISLLPIIDYSVTLQPSSIVKINDALRIESQCDTKNVDINNIDSAIANDIVQPQSIPCHQVPAHCYKEAVGSTSVPEIDSNNGNQSLQTDLTWSIDVSKYLENPNNHEQSTTGRTDNSTVSTSLNVINKPSHDYNSTNDKNSDVSDQMTSRTMTKSHDNGIQFSINADSPLDPIRATYHIDKSNLPVHATDHIDKGYLPVHATDHIDQSNVNSEHSHSLLEEIHKPVLPTDISEFIRQYNKPFESVDNAPGANDVKPASVGLNDASSESPIENNPPLDTEFHVNTVFNNVDCDNPSQSILLDNISRCLELSSVENDEIIIATTESKNDGAKDIISTKNTDGNTEIMKSGVFLDMELKTLDKSSKNQEKGNGAFEVEKSPASSRVDKSDCTVVDLTSQNEEHKTSNIGRPARPVTVSNNIASHTNDTVRKSAIKKQFIPPFLGKKSADVTVSPSSRQSEDTEVNKLSVVSSDPQCKIDDRSLPQCKIDDGSLPPCKNDDRSLPQCITDDRSLPQCKIDNRSLPQCITDDRSLPQCKIDNRSLPQCKIDDRSLPQCKIDDIYLPQCKKDDRSVPQCKIDDGSLPQLKIDDRSLPQCKIDDRSLPQRKIGRQCKLSPQHAEENNESCLSDNCCLADDIISANSSKSCVSTIQHTEENTRGVDRNHERIEATQTSASLSSHKIVLPIKRTAKLPQPLKLQTDPSSPIDTSPAEVEQRRSNRVFKETSPAEVEPRRSNIVSIETSPADVAPRRSNRVSNEPRRFDPDATIKEKEAQCVETRSRNIISEHALENKRHLQNMTTYDKLAIEYESIEELLREGPGVTKDILKECSRRIRGAQPRLMNFLSLAKTELTFLTSQTKDTTLPKDLKVLLKNKLTLLAERQRKLKGIYNTHYKMHAEIKSMALAQFPSGRSRQHMSSKESKDTYTERLISDNLQTSTLSSDDSMILSQNKKTTDTILSKETSVKCVTQSTIPIVSVREANDKRQQPKTECAIIEDPLIRKSEQEAVILDHQTGRLVKDISHQTQNVKRLMVVPEITAKPNNTPVHKVLTQRPVDSSRKTNYTCIPLYKHQEALNNSNSNVYMADSSNTNNPLKIILRKGIPTPNAKVVIPQIKSLKYVGKTNTADVGLHMNPSTVTNSIVISNQSGKNITRSVPPHHIDKPKINVHTNLQPTVPWPVEPMKTDDDEILELILNQLDITTKDVPSKELPVHPNAVKDSLVDIQSRSYDQGSRTNECTYQDPKCKESNQNGNFQEPKHKETNKNGNATLKRKSQDFNESPTKKSCSISNGRTQNAEDSIGLIMNNGLSSYSDVIQIQRTTLPQAKPQNVVPGPIQRTTLPQAKPQILVPEPIQRRTTLPQAKPQTLVTGPIQRTTLPQAKPQTSFPEPIKSKATPAKPRILVPEPIKSQLPQAKPDTLVQEPINSNMIQYTNTPINLAGKGILFAANPGQVVKSPNTISTVKPHHYSPCKSVISIASGFSTSSRRFLQKMKDKAVKIGQAKVRKDYQMSFSPRPGQQIAFNQKITKSSNLPQFPTLKMLIKMDLMKAEKDKLAIKNMGQTFLATLLDSGNIRCGNGIVFRTPMKWLAYVTNLSHCRRSSAYNRIVYEGRSLMNIIQDYKKNTAKCFTQGATTAINTTFDNHNIQNEQAKEKCFTTAVPNRKPEAPMTISIVSLRPQLLPGVYPTQEPHINMHSLLPQCPPIRSQSHNIQSQSHNIPSQSHNIPSQFHNIPSQSHNNIVTVQKPNILIQHVDHSIRHDDAVGTEEVLKNLTDDQLIKNIILKCRNVLLIHEREVVPSPELDDNFWKRPFKEVEMSKQMWMDVDNWEQ